MPEDIQQRLIEQEMKESYVDYAMSVIMSRALPDVRDGLKPVHRRILYSMWKLGLTHTAKLRKSAHVVGNVMAKYHPHGDAAIYDSLVRMAQDFSLRYPLIQGQGNFGNIDGDSAAAMRYTETRLQKIAEELLVDIDKDTVNFVSNYDNSTTEPTLLPSKIPNLLINGSSGIAVGMATNIPPHHLGEIIDGVLALIGNSELTVTDLLRYVKGPDFPTGGQIIGTNGIKEAYETGRGKIVVKGKAYVDDYKIVITEIPYMLNKSLLIEDMARLVREGVLEGISDLRDESDRKGMSIVIEVKKSFDPEVVLQQLYQHTALRSTFGVILLAVHDKKPIVFTLKDMLQHFLIHRKTVVTRRTQFDLKKAEEKAHLLLGLKIALEHVDEVVKLIKNAADVQTARQGLMSGYELSELQANAILDMKLQRLTSLETAKLKTEYEETLGFIEKCKEILGHEQKVLDIIRDELLELKEKYQDERRTEIVSSEEKGNREEIIHEENVVVTLTQAGYIKHIPLATYREQRRGGVGVKGAEIKEEDAVDTLFATSNKSTLLLFTNQGRVHWLRTYDIPGGTRYSKGKALVNLLQFKPGEKTTTLLPIEAFNPEHYLCMVTRQGIVKRVQLNAFENPRRGGIVALTLDDKDELVSVQVTHGQDVLVIATKEGNAAKFKEEDVRSMGRTAGGVIGVKLEEGDSVIGMEKVKSGDTILTVTQHGYGKRTTEDEYRLIHRGGKGVTNIVVNERNGKVVGMKCVKDTDSLLFATEQGQMIRVAVKDISTIGRATMGFRLVSLREGDNVKSVATVVGE
jgi:DNA gyrase subunit A